MPSPPCRKAPDSRFDAMTPDIKTPDTKTPTREFLENLKQAPRHIRASAMRNGKAPDTDRERSQSTFHNLFLHMQSVRTDRRSLRIAYSFGPGLILTASFVVLTITGILLMVYYKPGVELAYNSVKDIHFVVPAGRFIRNMHRWSAHLMVLAAFLHMARVFYTGSISGRGSSTGSSVWHC